MKYKLEITIVVLGLVAALLIYKLGYMSAKKDIEKEFTMYTSEMRLEEGLINIRLNDNIDTENYALRILSLSTSDVRIVWEEHVAANKYRVVTVEKIDGEENRYDTYIKR